MEYLNQGNDRSSIRPNLTKEHKSRGVSLTFSPKYIGAVAQALMIARYFGMAVHYYDEDDIVVEGNPSISSVVVNHHRADR